MLIKRANFFIKVVILALFASPTTLRVSSLGSMSSIAVSYGENGPAVCALNADGSHSVICLGADQSVVYGAPSRLPLIGLTAGDSFVCGLLLDSKKPYCWGSNFYVKMGVPQPMEEASSYSSISAGDHHLCGLRIPTKKGTSIIDCWGYNMTASHEFQGTVSTITAGSVFNCGLFERKSSPFCFGDETGSNVISLIPRGLSFQSISAGGFHVCGVLENFQVFCWGGSIETNRDNVEMVPMSPMVVVVGGRFHACGIKKEDRGVLCWGLHLPNSVPPPKEARVYGMAAGDYFTCGVDDKSLSPLCWGNGGPWSLQMTVSPGVCTPQPCSDGFFEYNHVSLGDKFCKPAGTKACMPCSNSCPEETYQLASCNSTSDISCQFNCSSCVSPACFSFCHLESKANNHIFFALQLPIFVAEIVFGVVLVASVSLGACLYVRYKLGKCQCSGNQVKANRARSSSFRKESVKVRPETEELKIQSIRMFTYEELDKATGGFKEESQVGKGSFSCVFKGVLKDGTVVAVKRPIGVSSSDLKKNSKEFRTELDLLSRLNHAHLLNLLGYCEEGGERLLVYEFMAHGSLYQHLHGKDPNVKEQLDWVRRVTITVQAARGIEYLHGYACPPVIHRDIKSSNILIDEEHNARVSDFGLSLLGPTDSSSPLSELPAGTLGYLDPEYYRLHYLTTKSDVYSFGVLLLEILSGRKAIDMRFDEGNIVEWAVPLIKAGNISSILDPALNPPSDIEAVKKIAAIACKCVRMKGKDRPSMDKVTTALERALALLMGSPCNDQPILPTEVVLGSSRLNKKASSQRSSNQSVSENEMGELEDQRFEYRAPSWITFPSVTSSSQRRNSVSEADVADGKFPEGKNNVGNASNVGDSLRCLEEEIGPASPQKDLFLQHNF